MKLGTIIAAKYGRLHFSKAAQQLRQELRDHMVLHLACHGEGNVKPKHHWMWDVADQLQEDAEQGFPFLIDMFVIERLHLSVKGRVEYSTYHKDFGRQVCLLISLPMACTCVLGSAAQKRSVAQCQHACQTPQ